MFYPDLFLYIPTILMVVFNINLITAYKIFIALFLCFMFFIFYKSLYLITQNEHSAVLGTIFLMLSRVLVMHLYHRFALGEFLAFAFILPCFAGMYDYVHNDFKNKKYLAIGFFGLISTHLITTVIVLIFCLIYFLINIKSTISNPKKFLKLILIALLVLLLSAYFWLPMIEQMKSQTFRYTKPWTDIDEENYSVFDYLANERHSIGFAITLTIPILIYAMFSNKIGKEGKKYFIAFIILSLIIVSHIFWTSFKDVLNVIQFSWRLIGVATVLYAISISLMFRDYTKEFEPKKIEKIILMFLVMLIAITFINYYYDNSINRRVNIHKLTNSIYINTSSLGGGTEYLPIEVDNVNLLYVKDPNIAYTEDGAEINGIKHYNSQFEFDNTLENEKKFIIPFVYYYGYVANVTTENGEVKPLEVSKSNEGYVQITGESIPQGKIRVWYNGTKVQKVSVIISCLTAVSVLGMLAIKNFKKKM